MIEYHQLEDGCYYYKMHCIIIIPHTLFRMLPQPLQSIHEQCDVRQVHLLARNCLPICVFPNVFMQYHNPYEHPYCVEFRVVMVLKNQMLKHVQEIV